jgi:uncharacterized protein YbjT (DUF2867 family)
MASVRHDVFCVKLMLRRTGATGSVGAAVTKELLKAGYRVRAATRSEEKSGYLKDAFRGKYKHELETVHVSDLLDFQAVVDAVKGDMIAIAVA